MGKALENLSLSETALSVNLIDLPKMTTQTEVLGEIEFLQKVLVKLNSVAKEVKKVGRYRASLCNKKVQKQRDSKVLIAVFNDSKRIESIVEKSQSVKDKSFQHIQLLYQKELGEQLNRREREQQMRTRQQRTREILKQNNLNKLKEKKKKQGEVKEKKRLFCQQMNLKQQKQLARVEKKMAIQKQNDHIDSGKLSYYNHSSPHMFHKILNFSKNVQENKMIQQQNQKARLERLSETIERKHKMYFLNRITQRANKTAKASKDNSMREAMERRIKFQKQKQGYYLFTLFEKMRLDKKEQSPRNLEKSNEKQASYETQHHIVLPSVSHVNFTGHTLESSKPSPQLDRSLKKSAFLYELSSNIQQRNEQSRLLFQQNREIKRRKQQQKIQKLNNKYHLEKIRMTALTEERKRQQNRHIHQNFKVRCKQNELHQQLQNILSKPNTNELETTLNYIGSGRCRMFESKQ